MELKIITKEENLLLSRIEVEAELSFNKAVPSAKDVKGEISKQLKADVELIYIKRIGSEFGERKAKVEAHVYQNKEAMKIIKKGKKALDKGKKGKEKEKAPKEEKKPAEKKEGKKEEAKKEEKKEEPKKEGKPAEEKKEKKEEGKKEEAPKEEKKSE